MSEISFGAEAYYEARFRQMVRQQQRSWWLPVLLGVLAAMPEVRGPSQTWVLLLAAFLPIVGVSGVLAYRWRRTSFRALLLMIDGLVFSIFPLLMLMVWNLYRQFNTYWLFSEHYFLYIAILMISLGYGVRYGKRRWPSRIEALGNEIHGRAVEASSVYKYLFASSEAESWATGKGRALIGMASVAGILVSGIGGGAYLFAVASLWAVILLPSVIVSALVRRRYLYRLLGDNDISIISGR